MPVTYEDALTHWDRSRAFGDPRDFQQFSSDMETAMPGQGFAQAGARDGWWTRASTRADTSFFHPIASVTTEPLGRAIGKAFGAEEAGAQVGRGLPRTLAQTLPLVAAEFIPGAQPLATAGLAATTGALFGAQTYADTGSAKDAAISGITAAALPAIGKFSGGLAARAFGAPVLDEATDIATHTPFGAPITKTIPARTVMPQNLTQNVARAVGGQAGIYGALLGQEKLETGEFHPLDPALLMQTIPFTALDLYGAVRAPRNVPTKSVVPAEEEPIYQPKPVEAGHSLAMGDTIDVLGKVLSSELASKEEKAAAFETLQQVATDPEAYKNVKLPQQPTLPKQETPAQSPFENKEEYVARLKAESAKAPESVDEIHTRIPNFEAAAKSGGTSAPTYAMLLDGSVKEFNRMSPISGDNEVMFSDGTLASTDAIQSIGDENGNTIWHKNVDPQKIVEETHGDARQKVSAATEAVSSTKQDEALTKSNAEKRGTGRATLLKNPTTGKTGFGSEAEALLAQEQHKQANPDQDQQFTFRVAKRGDEFVVRQKPKEVSYEGKEGTSLQNVIPDEPEPVKPAVDIKDLPTTVYNKYVDGFKKLRSAPTQAQHLFATDTPQEAVKLTQQFEVVLWAEKKGRTDLGKVNALLPDEFKFKNQDEYDSVKERGVQAMSERLALRQFDLGSPRPIEPTWQTKMHELGWTKPLVDEEPNGDFMFHQGTATNVMNWYATHPDTPEPIQHLFQAMLKAQPPTGVNVSMRPEEGWYYDYQKRNINVGYLPHDEIEATQWARQLFGHEYGHYVSREIWARTDPAAVRFKAETTNVLNALRESPAIPKNVKEAIKQSPAWGREFLMTGDEKTYWEKLTAAIGKDQANVWGHVVYGLSHESELMTMAFSSPKMLEVMQRTQMPQKATTVMQYFSQVWNKLFGGGTNTDNALAQFLTAYDNYLAGPKVPSLNEFLRPQSSKIEETVKQLEGTESSFENFKHNWEKTSNEIVPLTELPIVKEGHVRLWRGSDKQKANVLDEYTGRWFTPSYDYATNYGTKNFGYIDVPFSRIEETINRGIDPDLGAGEAPIFVATPEEVATTKPVSWQPREKIPSIARSRTYSAQDFVRDSLIPKGTRAEALMSRTSSIMDAFNKGTLQPLIEGFTRERGAKVLPAMFNTEGDINNVAIPLNEGTPADVFKSTMNLLAADVPINSDMWWQLRTDLDIMADLHDSVKKGQIRAEPPPNFTDTWRQMDAKVDKMEEALKKQKVALDRYNQLDNFNPEGFSRTIANQFEGAPGPESSDPTPLHQEALDALGFWKAKKTEAASKQLDKSALARFGEKIFRAFALVQHVQETMPEARAALDGIKNNQGMAMVRMDETNAAGIYDPKIGAPNPKILDDVKTLLRRDSPLNRVANSILRYAQKVEKEGNQVTVEDPFILDKLNRLGEPGKTKMLTYLNWRSQRRAHFVENVVAQEFLPTIQKHAITKTIVGHEPGMRVKVGEQLANDVYLAVKALDSPETIPFATDKLRQLSTQMRPETFSSAIGVARDLITKSQGHIDFMKSRPWYVSEMRLEGEHGLRMTTPEGKDWFYKFASQSDAMNKRDELQTKGYKFVDYTSPSNDIYSRGLNEDMIVRLERVLGETADSLKQSLQDKQDVLATVLPSVYNIAGELQADRAAFEPVPGAGFPRRKLVPGRELLNMVGNDYTSTFRYNNWMFHRLLKSRLELDLMDPEIQTRPDLVKYVTTHAENMLRPNNPTARAMSEFVYNWQVGANLGTNVLESLQSLNTGISELIAETGGVGTAFDLLGKTYKEVWHFNTKRQWSTPELAWLERWMQARGASGRTSWEGDVFDSDRALMHDANASPWMEIPNTIKWAARSWNGMFYRYNDRIGAVAGYLLGRERGMGQEEAANFAWTSKDKWAFTGGKFQRPVGLWSIKTTAVPQLLSSLQTYTLGWFSELALNYTKGYHGMEKMTPTQRSAARKAFLYQLGFAATMAGAMGLPGVGQGMAVVKQATGVDVTGWLKQHLADFFGEDQDSGGLWSSLALHGLTAAFSPIDMSGRGTNDIPFTGISTYRGFDLSQLGGAPATTASDLVQGIFSAMKGEPDLKKLTPAAIRGLASLYQGEGDVKDTRGRLIAKATPAEKFVMGMGLKPSRISDLRDVNLAAQEATKRASMQKGKELDQIAETYRTNPQDAKASVIAYLKTHPEDHPQEVVDGISNRVADATIPYDWRRHVNAAADVTGLSGREPSSEVARRQLQDNVTLGLGMRPRIRTNNDAAELDQMLNLDPRLTLAAAKKRLQATHPRPVNPYSILPQ